MSPRNRFHDDKGQPTIHKKGDRLWNIEKNKTPNQNITRESESNDGKKSRGGVDLGPSSGTRKKKSAAGSNPIPTLPWSFVSIRANLVAFLEFFGSPQFHHSFWSIRLVYPSFGFSYSFFSSQIAEARNKKDKFFLFSTYITAASKHPTWSSWEATFKYERVGFRKAERFAHSKLLLCRVLFKSGNREPRNEGRKLFFFPYYLIFPAE